MAGARRRLKIRILDRALRAGVAPADRSRRCIRALPLVAAIACLIGCAETTDITGPDDRVETDLPVLVMHRERPAVWQSNLMLAPLRLDAQGCLRFGGHFTIWHPDSRILRAPDGRIAVIDGITGHTVHVGEHMGASGHPTLVLPPADTLNVPIPAACGDTSVFVLGPVMNEAQMRELDQRSRVGVPVPGK